jgi:hypothetical protein
VHVIATEKLPRAVVLIVRDSQNRFLAIKHAATRKSDGVIGIIERPCGGRKTVLMAWHTPNDQVERRAVRKPNEVA